VAPPDESYDRPANRIRWRRLVGNPPMNVLDGMLPPTAQPFVIREDERPSPLGGELGRACAAAARRAVGVRPEDLEEFVPPRKTAGKRSAARSTGRGTETDGGNETLRSTVRIGDQRVIGAHSRPRNSAAPIGLAASACGGPGKESLLLRAGGTTATPQGRDRASKAKGDWGPA